MTEAIFKCQCGEQKKVSEKYIGKKVQCPKCKTIVEIQKFTPDENISKEPSAIAQCPCGYSKQLPSKYINKTATCPKCGKSIKIEELIDLKNLQETPISTNKVTNRQPLPTQNKIESIKTGADLANNSVEERSYIYCSSCGGKNITDAQICTSCGRLINPKNKEIIIEYSDVPWYRRTAFLVITFLFFWPICIIILWTGDCYYKKNHQIKLYSRKYKIAATLLLFFVTLAAIPAMPFPGESIFMLWIITGIIILLINFFKKI